jgi:protein FAM32A
MPADEYASFSGGALKLKGGKVKKQKKKKDKSATSLEKALSTAAEGGDDLALETQQRDEDAAALDKPDSEPRDQDDPGVDRKKKKEESGDDDKDRDEDGTDGRTEAEKRFAEAKRKRVCWNATKASR